jgi:hypothetical protein
VFLVDTQDASKQSCADVRMQRTRTLEAGTGEGFVLIAKLSCADLSTSRNSDPAIKARGSDSRGGKCPFLDIASEAVRVAILYLYDKRLPQNLLDARYPMVL